jgi:hypothetical protein
MNTSDATCTHPHAPACLRALPCTFRARIWQAEASQRAEVPMLQSIKWGTYTELMEGPRRRKRSKNASGSLRASLGSIHPSTSHYVKRYTLHWIPLHWNPRGTCRLRSSEGAGAASSERPPPARHHRSLSRTGAPSRVDSISRDLFNKYRSIIWFRILRSQ